MAKSKEEHIQQLTEKHQQTQGAIKNLQNIEEGLFKNLEDLKKKKGGGEGEKQELLEHIGKISAVRSNLFKDLKLEYDKQLSRKLGGNEKKNSKNAMLNNTEKQLNRLKRDMGRAQEVRANRKRMIEIGDYEFSRYEEHKQMMKIVAFTGFGIIVSVYLLKNQIVPETLAQVGIIASGAIGAIFLAYQLIDMWYRNNMNYQKYDFGMWYQPQDPKQVPKHQMSRWSANKKGFKKIFYGAKKSLAEAQEELKNSYEKDFGGNKFEAGAKGVEGDLGMQPGADGAQIPDSYEEQLHKLFSQKNCPEGASIRGYCQKSKGAKKKGGGRRGGGSGEFGDALGADDEVDARGSLVGNASEWRGLEFDKGSENFVGGGAGAGNNLSGVVVPFAGF